MMLSQSRSRFHPFRMGALIVLGLLLPLGGCIDLDDPALFEDLTKNTYVRYYAVRTAGFYKNLGLTTREANLMGLLYSGVFDKATIDSVTEVQAKNMFACSITQGRVPAILQQRDTIRYGVEVLVTVNDAFKKNRNMEDVDRAMIAKYGMDLRSYMDKIVPGRVKPLRDAMRHEACWRERDKDFTALLPRGVAL